MVSLVHDHYSWNDTERQIAENFNKLQYYFKCCGVDGSNDWDKSQWKRNSYLRQELGLRPNVNYPLSCCVQKSRSLITDMIPRNMALCQNKLPDLRQESRHEKVINAKNISLKIPLSCCVQSDKASSMQIIPLDSGCQKLADNSTANTKFVFVEQSLAGYFLSTPTNHIRLALFSDWSAARTRREITRISLYNAFYALKGCYQSMSSWLSQTSIVIISLSFSAVAIQIIGIAITFCLCRNLGEEF